MIIGFVLYLIMLFSDIYSSVNLAETLEKQFISDTSRFSRYLMSQFNITLTLLFQ